MELKISPGSYTQSIAKTFEELKSQKVIKRIWEKDYTLWSSEPTEIVNRLGWLFSPETTLSSLGEINDFVKKIIDENDNKEYL